MHGYYVLFLAVVGILALGGFVSRGRRRSSFLYSLRGPLLSPAERDFYIVLVQLLPGDFLCLVKPRLADVITPRKGQSFSGFSRVAQKHVDFLLVDASTFHSRAVIELDDSSHAWASSKRRDAVKDEALASAGLPILRVICRKSYDIGKLSEEVYTLLYT